MQALATDFPDIAVVVQRGPAASEAQTPPQLTVRAVDTAPLLGSFFAGFVEGKGARTLIIDGGDDYGLRIDDQFTDSKAWRQTGTATTAGPGPRGDPTGPALSGELSGTFEVAHERASRSSRQGRQFSGSKPSEMLVRSMPWAVIGDGTGARPQIQATGTTGESSTTAGRKLTILPRIVPLA